MKRIGITILIIFAVLWTQGCTSTQTAKSLSYSIRKATAQKAIVDTKIYDQLLAFVHSGFSQQVATARQQIHAIYHQRLGEAQAQLNEAFLTDFNSDCRKIDEAYRSDFDQINHDRGAADEKQRKAKTELDIVKAKLAIAEVEFKRRDTQRVMAEKKQVRFVARWEERQSAFTEVKSIFDASLKDAIAHVDQVDASVKAGSTGVEETLSALKKLDAALEEGTLQLDEYIHKKSEIALVGSAFFSQLGIPVDAESIDRKVGEVQSTIEGKLSSKVDDFVQQLNSIKRAKISTGGN